MGSFISSLTIANRELISNTMKILKIKIVGKWAELWIEGLPFEYDTYFDEDLMINLPIYESKKWNYCCKTGDLYQLTNDIQSLVGRHVEIDATDHIKFSSFCNPCIFEGLKK